VSGRGLVRRWREIVVPVVLAAGLVGCGSATGGARAPGGVTAAPSASAPSATGTTDPAATPHLKPSAPARVDCPASGTVVWVVPDAAAGLRAVSVLLTNCGPGTLTLRGHPGISVLDDERRRLPLTVRPGTVTTGVPNPRPATVRLAAGETAVAVLTWRGLVEAVDVPVLGGDHIEVKPSARLAAQTVALRVDAGTTRDIRITAWAPAPPDVRQAPGHPRPARPE
jgi:hypothetical protein